jgi:hypothetical protein
VAGSSRSRGDIRERLQQGSVNEVEKEVEKEIEQVENKVDAKSNPAVPVHRAYVRRNWHLTDVSRFAISETLVGTMIIGLSLAVVALLIEGVSVALVDALLRVNDTVWQLLPRAIRAKRAAWSQRGKPTILVLFLLIRGIALAVGKWQDDHRFRGIGYKVDERF